MQKRGDIASRELYNKVRLNDGYTIILGGVGAKASRTNEQNISGTGISLFQGNRQKDKTFMLFLTVDIIK